MKTNKKGSTGKQWLIAFSFMFILVFLFITFNNVYVGHLAPLFISELNSDTAGQQAEAGINFYMNNYNKVFYILFFIDLAYMFLLIIKEEPIERYTG